MKRSLSAISTLILLGLLQSCGGGEPDVGFTAFNGFRISGTITGMREGRGDLVIRSVSGSSSNSTTRITSSQTTYSTTGQFPSGTSVSMSIETNPLGQECTFSETTFTGESVDITGADITCEDVLYTLSGFPERSLPNGVQVSITGDRTADVVVNGAEFSLGEDFLYGENVNLAIASPNDSYSCTISPTQVDITSNVADINIACEETQAGLYGSLTVYEDGTGLSGVSDVALFVDNTSSFDPVSTVQTDAFGNFLFPLSTTGTYSVMAIIDGYVPNGKVVAANNLSDLPRADIALLQLTDGNTFTAETGGSITDSIGSTILTVGANALVDDASMQATGTVNSKYRSIDPSSDPAQLPGAFRTFDPATAARGYFETYGADYVELKDSTGNNLDLNTGQTSLLRIPVAQSIGSARSPTPIYYFDETSSYWIEDGTATAVSVNGEEYYEATVSNHSVWTAGQNITPITVSGCVTDFDGEPIANALVTAEGATYIGTFTATTDASGNFSLPVKANSRSFIFASRAGLSNTLNYSSSSQNETITECLQIGDNSAVITLTWSADPRDLDSHFVGPAGGNTIFHIDFTNRNQTVGDVPIMLDVDDTSGFGPEITTMPDFAFAGKYRFAVHHFSGSSNIAASGTRVELNLNGRVRVFTPNAAVDTGEAATNTWVVFEMDSDANGNVTVTEINNYITRSNIENNIGNTTQATSNAPASVKTREQDSYPPVKW